MIYFDNNATTQLAPEVLDAMRPFLESQYGNASSAYAIGRRSREAIDEARGSVARLLGAKESEVVFTSGGTEGDNWAIRGALGIDKARKHIVTTRVEHEAVRKLCEQLEQDGYPVTWVDVDGEGTLDLDQLRDSLRSDTALVSVLLANNETGVLFPVDEIATMVKENCGALVHVDGVNAVGKVPIDLSRSAVDLLSLSAHKFHGPKGVGALFIRDGVSLPIFSIGGGQENGRRAGTEAVHQIVGLGAAAAMVKDPSTMERVRQLRDRLESEVLAKIDGSFLNGTADPTKRLPNTSNISFENLNGEMIVFRLDEAGICVSTGSACHAADHRTSPVLEAMNIPFSRAMGSIRFSLGRYNTQSEVDEVVNEIGKIVRELRAVTSALPAG